MKKTKTKKETEPKGDFSVIVSVGNDIFHESGKTIVSALNKFELDAVKFGGRVLITVKNKNKSFDFRFVPAIARRLLAGKIQKEVFQKRALSILGD